MAMIGMPNIPNFKGLVNAGADAAISLGGAALIKTVFGRQWGIVTEFGVPILLSDSVISLDYNNTSTVSNAPIEGGSFTSYNKVQDPRNMIVQLAKGSGGDLARGAWLAQLEILVNSTTVFYVIMPEYVIKSVTGVGLSYARSAGDGVQMITANLTLEEIREVTIEYSLEEVADPSDTSTTDSGEVQPKDASGNTSILKKMSEIGVSGIAGQISGIFS